MKSIKSALLALFLLGSLGATVAHAGPYYHGGFYHGGYYGPRFGLFVDPWPLAYPYYPYGYSPYAAYPPVVVQPAAPSTYVEQTNPAPSNTPQYSAPSETGSDWYYCRKPAGYYPYVRSCPEAWQRVPARPPVQN